MNILFIVSGINSFGGIESFCRAVVPLIDFNKYQIDFLITQNEPHGESDNLYIEKGSRIYRIDSNGNIFKRIRYKKEFFKSTKVSYDIVHIHTVLTTAFYFARLVKKYTNAKVIIHSHTANNYEGAKLKNNLCRGLLNKYTDYRIACSKNAAEFLFGKKQAERTEIVFNPVDVSAFQFNNEIRITKRENLGLAPNDFVLLHVGRLTTAKNHKFLLQAFSEVHKQIANSKLLLCGDGELRSEIEEQIKNLNLVDSVILLGNRRDVNEIMSASDCFVFPSLYEGLPTVLVEAQTNGIPIIYSNRISDEVILSDSAVQLSIEHISLWVEAINNIFTQSRGRKSVTKEFLTDLESKFSRNSIVQQITSFYNTIQK